MSTEEKPTPRFIHSASSPADDWALSDERTVVFTVERRHDDEVDDDGRPRVEAVDYTMPSKPNAGLALEYLKRARREGADIAMSWLVEKAIGEDGYDALTEELAQLEPAEAMSVLRGVVGRIQRVAMGGLDAPKA